MKITSLFLIFPIFAAAALLLAACVLFSGCYTLKQGSAMLGYLNRAVPLESLLETDTDTGGDSAETEKNRRFVELVQDIRRFASEDLGLNMSKNYTRYVQIDRNYLAAVVSASARDSFTRHEWHYPVVGDMPYKGFFNVENARKERDKLEKKDLDVWVRGVDAFSTLGWFKDPLYSYMRSYSPNRLADLIIHEQLHATVFIKGQVQFNEELAEFVGSEGSRLYMESRFGPDSEEYRAMFTARDDSKAFVAFIRELIAELEALYASGAAREEKLREKEQIIASAKERFDAGYESRFTGDNYRGFSELPLNNACLELYRLYYAEDNFFADLYERSGRNLPALIAAAKTMTRKGDPKKQLSKALGLE
ncbi:MAG: aminopeptidase [Treponema sp.]|jgi:predicted aminopeptidase|nr:aminopeptidase [Treponema sp.]